MPLLQVENLFKSFGGLMAINNVSFSLEEGEIIGLIGPNGSGKTTTLNLITGFLKPNSGNIIFKGENIAGQQRYRVNQKGIARTFQLTKPFLDFTAVQNVMVGRAYGCCPTAHLKDAEKEAYGFLEEVGLLNKANVKSKDLRLMDRKRLELARALATKPRLLLMDEVMAGLNIGEADEAVELIKRIRDTGITILLVEHIVKAVVGCSNRIVVLNMGQKIAEGLPNEIIRDPQVIDVYLGKSHA